ncbi:MAG: hypothetical protein EOO28_29010 [Comamonadaceae bacterium]|nr:MAG: hypothetical protein EOO28_29010 [Comamonadaceae bacterium]
MSPTAERPSVEALARARDYLCIEPFLVDMPGASALATAFETGVIDHLAQKGAVSADALVTGLGLDPRGTALLLDMLRLNRVVAASADGSGDGSADVFALTPAFVRALGFRDLIEAKLQFARLVAPDVANLLTALLMEPAAFFERAQLFKLFAYQHAFEPSPDNYAQTARWMRLTTALTTHEAGAAIAVHDFSGYRRMLDVGGNSGEFALRLCRAMPLLQATVYDLPLVCDIGQAHVARESRNGADAGEAARIRFIRHERDRPALPTGCDLVTFKSMLHDWPDAGMADFLQRAHAALSPGGTVLIFERGPLKLGDAQIAYGQLPLMLFFRSYRAPERYRFELEALGFDDIRCETVELDMPFLLITARKPLSAKQGDPA